MLSTFVAASPPSHDVVASTLWSRELQFASDYVYDKRRRRRRSKRRGLQIDNWFAPDDTTTTPPSESHDNNNIDASSSSTEDGTTMSTTTTTTMTTCLSPLQKWFVSHIESIGVETWEQMNAYNITSLAYYYKHHVSGDDGTSEFFGTYGEKTDLMISNHNKLITFWSASESRQDLSMENESAVLASNNVLLLGMHGMDLADEAKLDATLQQIHQIDYNDAASLRRIIHSIIEQLPNTYNNPLLTANAMAIQSLNPDGSNTERDSIVIGDGIFEFLQWLDLANFGPAYIHAHEYGHHLQYNLQIDDSISNNNNNDGQSSTASTSINVAVVTRWWEMMADTFGSYFTSHSLGGALDTTTLLDIHRAAFSMGDCEDTIGTHHGTPRQRECASNYGADLALVSYYDGGYIIPPTELQRAFNEHYEKLVRLDSDECSAVVDEALLDATIYGEVMGGTAAAMSDYSAYLNDFTFDNPFVNSEIEEGDKPPPILLDENGTEYIQDEPGFWGTTWEVVGASPLGESRAVSIEYSRVFVASLCVATLYLL